MIKSDVQFDKPKVRQGLNYLSMKTAFGYLIRARIMLLMPVLFCINAACAKQSFPTILTIGPPEVPKAPVFSEPADPNLPSLASVPAAVELVKAAGMTNLRNKRVVLDARQSPRTAQLLLRYGDEILVGSFLKRSDVSIVPLYSLPQINAESHKQFVHGGDRKYDITLMGNVSQLLPYAPVIDGDALLMISIDSEPYREKAIAEPDTFKAFSTKIIDYRERLKEIAVEKEAHAKSLTDDFNTAKDQFLLDGGDPNDQGLIDAQRSVARNLLLWEDIGNEIAKNLESLPDVESLRRQWLSSAASLGATRTKASASLKVIDLSSQTIWGFGSIAAVGDDERKALEKVATALIDALFGSPVETAVSAPIVEEDPKARAQAEKAAQREERHRLRAERRKQKEEAEIRD